MHLVTLVSLSKRDRRRPIQPIVTTLAVLLIVACRGRGQEVDAPPTPQRPASEIERLPPPQEDDIPTPPVKIWSGSVEFGLNGAEGDADTFNMRLGAKTKRHTDFNTLSLELTHLNTSSDGVKTARNLLFDGQTDWPFGASPWTYYLHGTGEYDEFKPFDIRLATDAGLGYRLAEDDATTLIGRAGGSVSHEIGGPADDYVPELSASLEWGQKFNSRHRIDAKVEYYPDVTAFDEFRMNTRASWKIVVDPDWGLSLKLSVIERYDSTPTGGKAANIDYAALMTWSF